MANTENMQRDMRWDVCANCGLFREAHNIHGDCPPKPRSTQFKLASGPTPDPERGEK